MAGSRTSLSCMGMWQKQHALLPPVETETDSTHPAALHFFNAVQVPTSASLPKAFQYNTPSDGTHTSSPPTLAHDRKEVLSDFRVSHQGQHNLVICSCSTITSAQHRTTRQKQAADSRQSCGSDTLQHSCNLNGRQHHSAAYDTGRLSSSGCVMVSVGCSM